MCPTGLGTMSAMSGQAKKQLGLKLLHDAPPYKHTERISVTNLASYTSQGWRRTLVIDDLPKLNKGLFTDVTHGAFVRSWSKRMAALKRGARVTLSLSAAPSPFATHTRLLRLLMLDAAACIRDGTGVRV